MRRSAFITLTLALTGGCVSVEPLDPVPFGPDAAYRKPRRAPQHKKLAATRVRSPRIIPTRSASRETWMPGCGRVSSRWTSIVIHHSATSVGGAQRFDRHHTEGRGWDELGYHFVIGNGTDTPNGYIEVGSRWHKQKHGAHCKTTSNYYNEHGIGICLVGNFNETRPTPKQLASLERLVRYLCRTCGIPSQRVVTHHHVNGRTECPGRNFHVTALRKALGSPPLATSLP